MSANQGIGHLWQGAGPGLLFIPSDSCITDPTGISSEWEPSVFQGQAKKTWNYPDPKCNVWQSKFLPNNRRGNRGHTQSVGWDSPLFSHRARQGKSSNVSITQENINPQKKTELSQQLCECILCGSGWIENYDPRKPIKRKIWHTLLKYSQEYKFLLTNKKRLQILLPAHSSATFRPTHSSPVEIPWCWPLLLITPHKFHSNRHEILDQTPKSDKGSKDPLP